MNDAFACAFLRAFVFGDAGSLDCEKASRAAVTRWKDARRARALPIVAIDPRVLDDYVGAFRFEFDATRVLHVTSEGGRLFVDIPVGSKTEVFPASPTRFFFKTRPAQITFLGERPRFDRLEWVENGDTLPANRIR